MGMGNYYKCRSCGKAFSERRMGAVVRTDYCIDCDRIGGKPPKKQQCRRDWKPTGGPSTQWCKCCGTLRTLHNGRYRYSTPDIRKKAHV